MKRIPGKKSDKLKMLSALGEVDFLYLTADILYYIMAHTEVRILDGPGDGRRDIISKHPDTSVCLTQCKFHVDHSRTVGSRETDEIILALNKFNSKKGLFFTTGKISPQGKREYIDNFKDFELDFFEGTDIVELVLSNPTLSYIWFKNGKIEHVRSSIGIPFVISKNSIFIEIENLDKYRIKKDDLTLRLINSSCAFKYFEPFKPLTFTEIRPVTKNETQCYTLVCEGAIFIHEVANLKADLLDILSKNEELDSSIIRLGSSFIGSIVDNEFEDVIPIRNDPALSYIITQQFYELEQEWLLPNEEMDWIFPKRLGSMEAPWAAWYNPALDICLHIQVKFDYNIQPNFITEILYKRNIELLESSFFISISSDQINFLNKNTLNFPFNWSCDYGSSDKIVGWLNPLLIKPNNYTRNLSNGKPTEKEIIEKESVFINSIPSIRESINQMNYKIVSPNNALKISEVEGIPLVQKPEFNFYSSAELYHYYQDIPSPIDPRCREIEIVKFYKIFHDLSSARDLVSQRIDFKSKNKYSCSWAINIGPMNRVPFLGIFLTIVSDPTLSTQQILNSEKDSLFKAITNIELQLRSIFPKIESATEEFWNMEYGIIFRFKK